MLGTYERQLESSREAKRRRRGVCLDCGAETRYAGGSNAEGTAVALRCVACAARRNGERLRGQGRHQRALRELLGLRGPLRRSAIGPALGISDDHVSVLLTSELRRGAIRRLERGVYALADG